MEDIKLHSLRLSNIGKIMKLQKEIKSKKKSKRNQTIDPSIHLYKNCLEELQKLRDYWLEQSADKQQRKELK